jgi:hypothetical protein
MIEKGSVNMIEEEKSIETADETRRRHVEDTQNLQVFTQHFYSKYNKRYTCAHVMEEAP